MTYYLCFVYFLLRCLHSVLVSLLCNPYPKYALQLQGTTNLVQCVYVAWLCQQCSQSYYLYHFQCGISKGLHKNTSLLEQLSDCFTWTTKGDKYLKRKQSPVNAGQETLLVLGNINSHSCAPELAMY